MIVGEGQGVAMLAVMADKWRSGLAMVADGSGYGGLMAGAGDYNSHT